MPPVRENLIAARALIDTPEKWVKDAHEKDGCYCAMGAIGAVLPRNYHGWVSDTAQYRALAAAVPAEFHGNVPNFNDHPATTHADIMALFDRAIAAQENQS